MGRVWACGGRVYVVAAVDARLGGGRGVGEAGEMRMKGGTTFWEMCGAGRRCGPGVGGSAVTTHMRW